MAVESLVATYRALNLREWRQIRRVKGLGRTAGPERSVNGCAMATDVRNTGRVSTGGETEVTLDDNEQR